MNKNAKEIIITIFPTLSYFGISCCGPGCGRSPSSNNYKQELATLAGEIKFTFREVVRIEILEYGTNYQIEHATERLNCILKASGRFIQVHPGHFIRYVGSTAPIIAVNNRIVSLGAVPTWDQMQDLIKPE